MKRIAIIVGLVLVSWAAPAPAQVITFPNGQGLGSNPITNAQLTCPVAGDYSKCTASWTLATPGDCRVYIAFPQADPTNGGIPFAYSATPTTSCSLTVPYLTAGQSHGISFESCTGGGCTRADPSHNVNTNPFGGAAQTTMFTFTPPSIPSPPGSFAMNCMFTDSAVIAAGYEANISISCFQQNGTTPGATLIPSITLNANACTPALMGGTCGPLTHIPVQAVFGNNEATTGGYGAATRNYVTTLNGSSQYYHLGTSPVGGWKQLFVNVRPDSSAAPGTYTLIAQVQAQDGSGGNLGSAVTVSTTFVITAAPTFTFAAPGSFPALPSLANWNLGLVGYAGNFLNFQSANQTAPGAYLNDNWSADEGTFDPTGVFTYGGDGAAISMGDYCGSSYVGAWQASHSYALGAIVKAASGYCWVVTTAGTSGGGSSPLAGSTVLGVQGDGTGALAWTNIGGAPFWDAMSQRVGDQLLKTLLLQLGGYPPAGTTVQEWNDFTDGTERRAGRQYTSPSTSLNELGIAYAVAPFTNPPGFINPDYKSIYQGVWTPIDTVRALPYDGNDMVNWELLNGTRLVVNGIDEPMRRAEVCAQVINELAQCTDKNLDANFPCNGAPIWIAPPTFDVGLCMEFDEHLCNGRIAIGSSCDPLLPTSIATAADYLYSYQFNQTGSDYVQPYTMWEAPGNSQAYDFTVQSTLNNLAGPMFWWLWSACGGCTLPTSGISPQVAGDAYFEHVWDQPCPSASSGKCASQKYKLFWDGIQWRTGAWTYNQTAILPSLNPYNSAWPNALEPFPLVEFASAPTGGQKPVAVPGSNSATFTWYVMYPVTSCGVRYAVTPANPASGTLVTGAASSVVNATIGESQCAVTVPSGLTASTQYNWSTVATNTAGTANSSNDIDLDPAGPFTFTTLAPTLIVTTAAPLPAGTAGTPYSTTLACSGGSGSYTWVVTLTMPPGGVPGLTMNSTTGVYSGTPTRPGVYEVSVRCTDTMTGNFANKALPGLSIAASPTAVPSKIGGAAKIGGQAVIH